MKLSHSIFGSLIVLSSLFYAQTLEAGFSNGGRMQSKNLNLTIGGTLENNGELIGTESATITCDTISGKGLIRSPQISLTTKIFAYTGKIECDGKCTIITSAPFDDKMFTRSGKGEFIIIIDENPTKKTIHEVEGCFNNEDLVTDGLFIQLP